MQNFREDNVTRVFIDNTATNNVKDITAVTKNGTTISGLTDIIVRQTGADGTIENTGIIAKDLVKSVSKSVYKESVPKYAAFTYTAAKDKYAATISVQGFGSLSFENEAFVPGWYDGADGTTALDVAKGISANLRLNLSKIEPVTNSTSYIPTAGVTAYFETADFSSMTAGDYVYVISEGAFYKATGAAAASVYDMEANADSIEVTKVIDNPWFNIVYTTAGEIVVAEKPQAWSREKKVNGKVMFNVVAVNYKDDVKTSETVSHQGPITNPVNAKDLCDLEAALYANFGDQYSNTTFPQSFDRGYKGDPTGTYKVVYTIVYTYRGAGINYGTETDKTLKCAFKADPTTATQASAVFETAIETALGVTL